MRTASATLSGSSLPASITGAGRPPPAASGRAASLVGPRVAGQVEQQRHAVGQARRRARRGSPGSCARIRPARAVDLDEVEVVERCDGRRPGVARPPCARRPAHARQLARAVERDAARAVGHARRTRPGRPRPSTAASTSCSRVSPQILTSGSAARHPHQLGQQPGSRISEVPTSTASAPASRAASTSARERDARLGNADHAARAATPAARSWRSRSTSSVSRSRALTPDHARPDRQRARSTSLGACAPRPACPSPAAAAVSISRRASSSETMPRMTRIASAPASRCSRDLLREDREVLGQGRDRDRPPGTAQVVDRAAEVALGAQHRDAGRAAGLVADGRARRRRRRARSRPATATRA